MRLSEVAAAMGVSAATASDAVSVLVKKDLVARERAADDRRAIAIRLTATGKEQAARAATWPDFLVSAIESMSESEQRAFFGGISTVIRSLQDEGIVAASRMCLSCKYFRANVCADERRPHHCDLVGAAFGDPDLRLDCPEHEPANRTPIVRSQP